MNLMVRALKAFSHKALRCFTPGKTWHQWAVRRKTGDARHVPLPDSGRKRLSKDPLLAKPETRWSFFRHQGIYCVLSRHETIQGHKPGLRNRKPTPEICATACSFAPEYRGNDDFNGGKILGRVAPGNCSPRAPTDPDVQISRIRLFGARFRYVTVEERM